MRRLKIHGVYQHYKGDYYLVEETAIHSETGEEMVIYRKLYEDGSLFVRPKEMFLSEIDHGSHPEAKAKYRFTLKQTKSVRK